MLLGVKNRLMFGLVFRVWMVQRFALFEVWSAQPSVLHELYAYGHQRLTATRPNPTPPLPVLPKHHNPPCIPYSTS